MGRPTTPDFIIRRSVQAYDLFNQNKTRAARELNIPRQTLQDHLKIAAKRGMMGFDPVLPGMMIASTNTTYDREGEVARQSVRQILEPGPKFEPLPTHFVRERSTLVDGDQNIKLEWIKERANAQQEADVLESIKTEFEEYRGRAEIVPHPQWVLNDIMQVYPVVDPHIGMLSWGRQTGQPNDLQKGVDRMYAGASSLVSLAPPAATALIINTGDFFHADDQRNVTPAHHHQLDVDGRADKVRYFGVGLLRRMIDMALAKHETVIVKNLRGNHDPESAGWLNIALGMFYENNPRVQIDAKDGNNDIFLHLFGKNYIGATHGHTMKPERMAMVMADDRPDYWGASEHRWMIFGHVHHESVKEVGSVRCESFRQPVPKDAHAHSHGYRAGNSMQSITLHREDGEIGRHKINFPRMRAAA